MVKPVLPVVCAGAGTNSIVSPAPPLSIVDRKQTRTCGTACCLPGREFDGHLAQQRNLSALFISLNDEIFEIRELALCIIGR
ncbi:hypothetical protein HPB48_005815 [Haemaphysalis longicornis]|uniref:Uncharacterized protein n=1 Tax=Haemaphysalis longicornis TaxID=44386 RepID=A0A9J6GQT0_HAELO|nr:hypothetical protein HPB48_005815 [Haemaphysalis longicornis]